MRILLVNPPVYDFALHDYWLKPYGLLRIASALKRQGIPFDYFDFLYRGHPFYENVRVKTDEYGRGKYYFEEVKKPEVVSFVPRKFKRYGIPLPLFAEEVKGKSYDFIFITTGMTYWYLGVKEIIDFAKAKWPEAKVVVGGISATLMPEFYRHLGADVVVEGDNLEVLKGFGLDLNARDEVPNYDVYPKLSYAVIRVVEGCPFKCPYCASYKLKPVFRVMDLPSLANVVFELFEKRGVRDFVFYDDALLLNAEKGIFPFFKELEKKNLIGKLRFHTPNALHVKKIDRDIAYFLKAMGFETIFLGVETTDYNLLKQIGEKLNFSDFERAVFNLKMAGFEPWQITAYLFLGIPGQTLEEIEESIRVVTSYGVRVSLSEFSPIPGTPLGDEAIQRYQIKDPLLTNNSVFPILVYGFEAVNYLKNLKNTLEKTYLSRS